MLRFGGRGALPRSIVARTTLVIIALAALIGVLFAGVAARTLQRSEAARLETRLDALLGTVESTVSIACFVKDPALAHEVAAGLMRNETVVGVRITVDGATLAEAGNVALPAADALSLGRTVMSPFNPRQDVGQITLFASREALQALAWSYTRYIVLALAFQLALVAFAVIIVVYRFVTRPIKGISDELHRLELRTGMKLGVPRRNERDEIGRLVADVNALIGRLTGALDTEHQLRVERETSERRLANIFEKVDAGLFEVDAGGSLRSWNPAFVRTLGLPQQPPTLQALLPQHEERLRALIAESLAAGASREADFELPAKGGTLRWVEMSLSPVDGRMLQGVVNDISDRKRGELAAQQMASRDGLTGLLNRRGLDAGLAAAFERRALEPQLALTVLQIDLDFFKEVNDTHGHHAGDVVLKRVAEVLERTVRRSDLVARVGGDEFVVVLIGTDSPAKGGRLARAIVDGVGQPIDIGRGVQVQVGASIGVAVVAPSDSSATAAMNSADQAMYAAKQAGRNRWCLAPTAPPPDLPTSEQPGAGTLSDAGAASRPDRLRAAGGAASPGHAR